MMVEIENLTKRYGSVTALDNLSLSIDEGVIFGLLGQNGAGKSTLLSILNGLTAFDAGKVRVFGQELREGLSSIRRNSALIPQNLAFYDNLTVLENLRFFAGIQRLHGAKAGERIDMAVSVNRLEGMLGQRSGTLSGGQKRRLNIAIGLLNDPKLLYFDEPTVGIDPQSRNEILETIRSFKALGKSVIYTSHYMQEVEKICDEVAIIDRGKILRRGQIDALLHEEDWETIVTVAQSVPPELLETLGHPAGMEENRLLLPKLDGQQLGEVLSRLEKAGVRVRQVQMGMNSLESVFVRLTSREDSDV